MFDIHHCIFVTCNRVDLDEWLEVFNTILHKCKEACMWLVDYLSTQEGFSFIK